MMYPEEKRRLRVVHRAFSPAALQSGPPLPGTLSRFADQRLSYAQFRLPALSLAPG